MLNKEEINIKSVISAIKDYKGFTKGEKVCAITSLEASKKETCSVEELIEHFNNLSLNIIPFLEETGFIKE